MADPHLRRDALTALDAVADADGWAFAADVAALMGIPTHNVSMVLMHARTAGLTESRNRDLSALCWGLTETGANWLEADASGQDQKS